MSPANTEAETISGDGAKAWWATGRAVAKIGSGRRYKLKKANILPSDVHRGPRGTNRAGNHEKKSEEKNLREGAEVELHGTPLRASRTRIYDIPLLSIGRILRTSRQFLIFP